MAPNIAMPTRNTTASVRAMTGVWSRDERQHRIGARRSTKTNRRAARRSQPATIRAASPPSAISSALMPAKRSAAPSQSTRTCRVSARARIRQRDDGRSRTERDVEIEHPAPGERIGDVAADKRAGDRRDAPDAAEERLRAGALRQRVELADDRHAQRDDRAGAEALNRPRGDQHDHRGRGARQHRPNEEDDDPSRYMRRAVEIGEPPPDRHGRRRRQQVGGEHPAVVRESAERGDHGGHRGADDGRFERAEAHAEQQAGGDRAAAGEADRKMGCWHRTSDQGTTRAALTCSE